MGILNASQKRTNRAAFERGIYIQTAGQDGGLVRYDPDGPAVHSREPDDNVLGEMLLDLKEPGIIGNAVDDVPNIIRSLRVRRNN